MNDKKLEKLKEKNEAPHWMSDEGYATISKGYLLENETPKEMWKRVSNASAQKLKKPELADKFFNLFWNNWLCGSTPVLANSGTDRGINISCYSEHLADSVHSIFQKQVELAALAKHGGGVGVYFGWVRGRGEIITNNGFSEGILPWLKCYDSATVSISQGGVRRAATAIYIPVEHTDIEEFINMRRPVGDINRRCMNLHHGVCLSDNFLNKVQNGDKDARKIWTDIIRTRFETGEPYLFFSDNVNRQAPECYKQNNLTIKTSNICSEIFLFTDPDHTFVCCLSSLNLARYDEWKNTETAQLAIWFLDGIMQEFIDKAKEKPGFEAAVRFAEKSRALGLGVLGWHTLLQSKKIAFDSFDAMALNAEIFKHIRSEADIATRELAKAYGEPLWCKGFGIRNTHLLACAPTVSNSIISGSVSAGIEPISANIYSLKTAKGTFFRYNPTLKQLLADKGKDNIDTWKVINQNDGSVAELDFLSDAEKEVFLTAREINQFAIIRQAAQRQKWIDQGQSINLFFTNNSSPKYINEVHLEAWRSGLKSLYYCRAEAALKGDSISRQKDECKSCEG